jgi:hypothetical protein
MLRQLEDAGMVPSAHAHLCAMRACAAFGRWEPLLAILSRMREHGQEPSAEAYGLAVALCDDNMQAGPAAQLRAEAAAAGVAVAGREVLDAAGTGGAAGAAQRIPQPPNAALPVPSARGGGASGKAAGAQRLSPVLPGGLGRVQLPSFRRP